VNESIRKHSKSFSLAAMLLPRAIASDAVLLYAYCRRADDAIDLVPDANGTHVAALRAEVDAMHGSQPLADPLLAAMRDLVSRRAIPRAYFDELVAGLEMDACGTAYASFADLVTYAYRVAGIVGLMMCHVMGVRDRRALVHAAHLGIAMQLTNVARDVHEDWRRGRLYLPDEMLERAGATQLRTRQREQLPLDVREAVSAVTEELLVRAEAYYRSGDAGVDLLSPRCAFAVRVARLVYSRIGARVRQRGCDPLAPRAMVSSPHKYALVARALIETAVGLPAAMLGARPRAPHEPLDFGELPLLEPR
jgi:phytoene synthase